MLVFVQNSEITFCYESKNDDTSLFFLSRFQPEYLNKSQASLGLLFCLFSCCYF